MHWMRFAVRKIIWPQKLLNVRMADRISRHLTPPSVPCRVALDASHCFFTTAFYRQAAQRTFKVVVCSLFLLLFSDDSSRPLDTNQLKRLQFNWSDINDRLNVDLELIGKMYSAGCVTRRQRERLSALLQSDQSNINARLLDMMRRKSCAHSKKFLECLQKTNQGHVAVLLVEAASTYIK
jgi:hypothetical protein